MTNYKLDSNHKGVNLIPNGFKSYSVNGNTMLGKLLNKARKSHPGCVVWYKVNDEALGDVDIIYKEVR